MEARSSVVAMTLRAPCAGAAAKKTAASARRTNGLDLMISGSCLSEGMGAVGADGELELEEELVGLDALAVARVAVLAADLAELARPVREESGDTFVDQGRILGALRMVEAQPREPALSELVLQRPVDAEGVG